jgi:hypothetical protein
LQRKRKERKRLSSQESKSSKKEKNLLHTKHTSANLEKEEGRRRKKEPAKPALRLVAEKKKSRERNEAGARQHNPLQHVVTGKSNPTSRTLEWAKRQFLIRGRTDVVIEGFDRAIPARETTIVVTCRPDHVRTYLNHPT